MLIDICPRLALAAAELLALLLEAVWRHTQPFGHLRDGASLLGDLPHRLDLELARGLGSKTPNGPVHTLVIKTPARANELAARSVQNLLDHYTLSRKENE
jgi:hypothetical protein